VGVTATAEPGVEHRTIKRAKTSAAAATALAIGSAAFVLTLPVLFFPVALILGVIGLLLGIVGFRATKKPGVTGEGVRDSAQPGLDRPRRRVRRRRRDRPQRRDRSPATSTSPGPDPPGETARRSSPSGDVIDSSQG